MDAQKKLGKKGTLTIPQQLRHQLGLQGGRGAGYHHHGGRRPAAFQAPARLQYLRRHPGRGKIQGL